MQELERTLVVRAQRGDRTAFEKLVRRTSRLVFARLYLETGDAHRTEDLLQETLLRAWGSLEKLKEPEKLRSWLLAIAQNVSRDAARRETTQKRSEPPREQPAALSAVPMNTPPPEVEADIAEQRQRVVQVLRELPEEYRLPLTMRYITGADYKSIQAQLGLTNGSLRGMLHRGLKILRERLGPEFAED